MAYRRATTSKPEANALRPGRASTFQRQTCPGRSVDVFWCHWGPRRIPVGRAGPGQRENGPPSVAMLLPASSWSRLVSASSPASSAVTRAPVRARLWRRRRAGPQGGQHPAPTTGGAAVEPPEGERGPGGEPSLTPTVSCCVSAPCGRAANYRQEATQ